VSGVLLYVSGNVKEVGDGGTRFLVYHDELQLTKHGDAQFWAMPPSIHKDGLVS
jgi:hypothetical protein